MLHFAYNFIWECINMFFINIDDFYKLRISCSIWGFDDWNVFCESGIFWNVGLYWFGELYSDIECFGFKLLCDCLRHYWQIRAKLHVKHTELIGNEWVKHIWGVLNILS